ncbi:MAG: hypothetical protein JW810_11405 [Sedimentisphaerales bacterium]|nr:hypothetical protein [Sedimentisphaerales bacterium]
MIKRTWVVGLIVWGLAGWAFPTPSGGQDPASPPAADQDYADQEIPGDPQAPPDRGRDRDSRDYGRRYMDPSDKDPDGGPPERFRGFFGRVNTEDLMKFLRQYEPELAKNLDSLNKDNPAQFEQQIDGLRRLYGPIMRLMDENPPMAQLSLKAIRLRLQVQGAVKKAKEATDQNAKAQTAQKLQADLGDLFDVICRLEEMRLEEFSRRMQDWAQGPPDPKDDRLAEPDKRDEPRDREEGFGGPGSFGGGRGQRPGRGGPGGWDRQRSAQFFHERLEQRKINIETWKKNKDQIVQQRVDQLLQGYQPFPWGG